MLTGIDAIGTDVRLSLFASNCGRPNSTAATFAVGASQSSSTDVFGTIRVASLPTAKGAFAPGGVASSDQGMTYFFTNDGTTNIDGRQYFQTYSPCSYNGALAYCTGVLAGYDYDGDGPADVRSICIAFMEGKYCDGAQTTKMYGWRVMNGGEISIVSNYWAASGNLNVIIDPYKGPGNEAKFACITTAKMPDGAGFSTIEASSAASGGGKDCDLCTA